MTIYNLESTESSTMKPLHTNTLVCNFEIFTQIFISTTMVDWMQQLRFIIGSVACTKFPVVAPKEFEKSLDLCTEHSPLKYIKTYSRVFI